MHTGSLGLQSRLPVVFYEYMKNKNSPFHTRTIKQDSLPNDKTDEQREDELRHKRLIERSENLNKFVDLSNTLAESSFYHRNWKWIGADQHYPNHPLMRTVAKYFPHAKGGPLYIDEPVLKEDIDACYIKQKVMKKLGYRYVVREPDSTLEHMLQQLGDL